MGCGSSGAAAPAKTTAESREINKVIQDKIEKERSEEKAAVKILLLGAGECGKSTILKQMKIINMGGFGEEEAAAARLLVFKNTLDSIQSLILACTNDLDIKWKSDEGKAAAERVIKLDSSATIPYDCKDDITAVWNDEACKEAVTREAEFHLIDSAKYFLDKVQETFCESFVPTQTDILRTRLTTTGIIETCFTMEDMVFKMYDVGGQRGERKKWIHAFDSVTTIMFIAALSEYNQVLAEDRTRNRMTESMSLFEGIANLPWFANAPIIIFLNKNDLFVDKIAKIDMGDYHPEYTGGCDYDAALEYIQEEYGSMIDDETKQIYFHVTDATNTENVSFVWAATKKIILSKMLRQSGLAR